MLCWMNFLLLRVVLLKSFLRFSISPWMLLILGKTFVFLSSFSRFSILLWSVHHLFTKARVLRFKCSLNFCLSTFFSIIYVYTILGLIPNLGDFPSFCLPNSISFPNCPGSFLKYLSLISSSKALLVFLAKDTKSWENSVRNG